MKKHKMLSLPPIGGSALLVSFAVLCLTVLALLSLSTVLAERRLSDAAAEAAASYYEADLQAETVFAKLRAGETVPEVTVTEDRYTYHCPISEHQWLDVELQRTDEAWTILRWQTMARSEDAAEETLPVWDGN